MVELSHEDTDLPVKVFSGVAHAVDAVVVGEVLFDGLLQRQMVLLCQGWSTAQGTSNQPHPSLTIHLHSSDACMSIILPIIHVLMAHMLILTSHACIVCIASSYLTDTVCAQQHTTGITHT